MIYGDGSIIHGATVKGLRIEGSQGFGIFLVGSKGASISNMEIVNSYIAGLRCEGSSLVLEDSRFVGNRAIASIRITRGSQAVLVGNDIQGLRNGVQIDSGSVVGETGWAPSQALLIGNHIHDNGANGLLVRDKGSEVRGVGNRYDANRSDGVSVVGGAIYVGQHETVTNSLGNGVTAWGCYLSGAVLVQEETVVTLDSADIRENKGIGAYALCGATIEITKATIANNRDGVFAESPVNFNENQRGSGPATLNIRDSSVSGNVGSGGVVLSTPYAEDQWANATINSRHTVFAGHQQGAGIWLLGKGAVGHGTDNRYEGNFTGLQVSGGASYFGHGDTIQDSTGLGLFVLGEENMCNSPGCSTAGIVQGQAQVTMDGATIKRNGGGMTALCGATVLLRNSAITGNLGSGTALTSTCDWGDLGAFSAPVVLDARGTVFANNPQWGVIAYGDSHLLLGTLADPGRNSFLGNLDGAIANITLNPVLAQWNWFGTTDAAAIALSIVDCRADPSYGCVDYVPFLSRAPPGQ